jgi:hypothetical protein
VFYNGVRVVETVDYTAGDGTSISFTLPPLSNSTIEMVSYGPISFVDSVARSGDTMGGTLNVRDLIPVSNNIYNLGNTTNRFSNVYLSGNTIVLGNTIISSNGFSVSFTDSNNTPIPISANLSGSLPATGVTANTYGNTTAIPVITIDSTGRITNASTSSVSGGGSSAADDTTTNGTRYVLFANQTTGTISTAYVSSTKLTYNPSTGTLTSTLVTSSSDENLKTNIKTIDEPIEVINSLRGVSFDRIDTDQSDFGVIAQEVEKIIPEVVHQDVDGYKSVSYNSIIGFLIEGMKQQQKKLDSLEREVGILKSKG